MAASFDPASAAQVPRQAAAPVAPGRARTPCRPSNGPSRAVDLTRRAVVQPCRRASHGSAVARVAADGGAGHPSRRTGIAGRDPDVPNQTRHHQPRGQYCFAPPADRANPRRGNCNRRAGRVAPTIANCEHSSATNGRTRSGAIQQPLNAQTAQGNRLQQLQGKAASAAPSGASCAPCSATNARTLSSKSSSRRPRSRTSRRVRCAPRRSRRGK